MLPRLPQSRKERRPRPWSPRPHCHGAANVLTPTLAYGGAGPQHSAIQMQGLAPPTAQAVGTKARETIKSKWKGTL